MTTKVSAIVALGSVQERMAEKSVVVVITVNFYSGTKNRSNAMEEKSGKKMNCPINEYQLKELDYEIDVFPDIIQIALKKMRIKTVIEVTRGNFDRFFKLVQKSKYDKYYKQYREQP